MKFCNKKDIILIGIIIVLTMGLLLGYKALFYKVPPIAEIYIKDQKVLSLPLDVGKETTFTVKGRENVKFHVYKDGSIAFIESDCPDKVCINSGQLSMVGQSAACLPNALILKLVPEKGNGEELDVVI